MENFLLTSLTVILLLGVREVVASPVSTTISSTFNSSAENVTSPPVIQTPCPKPTNITQFVLARLTIKGGSRCEGQLYITYLNQIQTPLCFSSQISNTSWKELCDGMGCGRFIDIKNTSETTGLIITSNMALENEMCMAMRIRCKDPIRDLNADVKGLKTELVAYKAVTGIFIFLILCAIMLHFSRPTYKTIRKRFSQKRQSRWIGPTQSQSVSYHRGQGPPNNNTVKRQSYPGLERLMVNTSREPSSNRNSDYDSYSYN